MRLTAFDTLFTPDFISLKWKLLLPLTFDMTAGAIWLSRPITRHHHFDHLRPANTVLGTRPNHS